MRPEERLRRRPSLSFLALISFIASFGIARAFTSISPDVTLVGNGLHIHHFWFGIIMLAIGGWLGISYNEERIDRLAAVIYGAGGGLIGDEVGLLLTFGNYWDDITYTILVVFLVSAFTSIVFMRYHETILSEIRGFTRNKASLYLGVFLAAISMAFITSDNSFLVAVSVTMAIIAWAVIIAYLALRVISRHQKVV